MKIDLVIAEMDRVKMFSFLNAESERAVETEHRFGILDRDGNMIKTSNRHRQPLSYRRKSSVFLHRVLDGGTGFGEIIWCHDGTDLDARVKRKESRLGDSWDLRRILHLKKNKSGSLAVVVGKVNRLRFQICQYRLDRGA